MSYYAIQQLGLIAIFTEKHVIMMLMWFLLWSGPIKRVLLFLIAVQHHIAQHIYSYMLRHTLQLGHEI